MKLSVKFAFSILLAATLASAEPHPSFWTYASPEATALVAIKWNNLQHSPFAAAIEAQISDADYFDDVHGSAAYKRHLTYYYAEQIRAELAPGALA